MAVIETPIPGGAKAGGNAPHVVVSVPAGGAVGAGIAPAVIVWPALLPPLAEALQRLDQLNAFHVHPPPDHHDDVATYTDATVALLAFVIAVLMALRRASTGRA